MSIGSLSVAVPLTRFAASPAILTLHHPHEPTLTALYEKYPDVQYIAISGADFGLRIPLAGVDVGHRGCVDDRVGGELGDDLLHLLALGEVERVARGGKDVMTREGLGHR